MDTVASATGSPPLFAVMIVPDTVYASLVTLDIDPSIDEGAIGADRLPHAATLSVRASASAVRSTNWSRPMSGLIGAVRPRSIQFRYQLRGGMRTTRCERGGPFVEGARSGRDGKKRAVGADAGRESTFLRRVVEGGTEAYRCRKSGCSVSSMTVTSHANTDRQPIVARDADSQLGGEARVEIDELVPQRFAPFRVEAVRQNPRRAVALREGLPRRFGARLAIERGGALESQRERGAEQLLQPIGGAPLERRSRRRVRRRRHVAPHDLEHVEHVAVRRPRRERDPAALAHDAGELRGRGFLTGGEHDPHRRDDGIERSVVERQALGVADSIVDGQVCRGGGGASRIEEIGGDVAADYRRAAPRDEP